MYFENSIVIVFGGTGSIGLAIVEELLIQSPAEIRIFSNNENEIFEARMKFLNHKGFTLLTFIIGNIRDIEPVSKALLGVDFIFNCAALKHVDLCEENVIEAVKTNILGLDNILNMASENCIGKMIHISTDKAVEPSSVMGATKLIGERLCLSYKYLQVSVVRFGNVYGSRGSLIPIVNERLENGRIITLTDKRMKRFFIEIKNAAKIIINTMVIMSGGEIFIPKMDESYIIDIIYDLIKEKGFSLKDVNILEIGARPGEKLSEKLMTEAEKEKREDLGGVYMIK